jgi:hypothetical protein
VGKLPRKSLNSIKKSDNFFRSVNRATCISAVQKMTKSRDEWRGRRQRSSSLTPLKVIAYNDDFTLMKAWVYKLDPSRHACLLANTVESLRGRMGKVARHLASLHHAYVRQARVQIPGRTRPTKPAIPQGSVNCGVAISIQHAGDQCWRLRRWSVRLYDGWHEAYSAGDARRFPAVRRRGVLRASGCRGADSDSQVGG